MKVQGYGDWTRPAFLGLAKELAAGAMMLGVLAAGGDPTSVQGGLLGGFDYPSLDFEISLAGEYNGTVGTRANQVVLPPHSTVFPRAERTGQPDT